MRSIVVFCVRGVGHMHALLPVIDALGARGHPVHVMTGAEHRDTLERCGARFFDLFARYPLEAADATSRPIPARYVTFAGVYAERVTADVAALDPGLIVYDTFSVVAPVVAQRLGIPYVNVCPNHAPVPSRVLAALRNDPRVAISPECWAAVQRLKDVHGHSGASPFAYVEALSPFLNIYAEPEEFLDHEDRLVFEPIAFFGSLAPNLHPTSAVDVFPPIRRGLRILVSFGTLIWRYFEAPALAALDAVARACADLDVDAVISLGGHPLAADAQSALSRPNVHVVSYSDQWAVLQAADVFITHHGINSTHESIYQRVPMISYPFLGDQPALARRCQDLGLAVPLVDTPGAPVTPEAVRVALSHLDADRPGFAARLATAREWELRTIAQRGAVIDRILSVMNGL